VRTGVTAVFPRGATNGDRSRRLVHAERQRRDDRTTWLEESGFLAGPVMITNTHSVGVVRDAVIEWLVHKDSSCRLVAPVVAETWDRSGEDINGFTSPRSSVSRRSTARRRSVAKHVGEPTWHDLHQLPDRARASATGPPLRAVEAANACSLVT